MNRSPRSDRRGIAAVEFALVAPALLLVLLSVVDLVGLIRASWRMERSAGELGNVIAQLDGLSEADFPVLFGVADQLAAPYVVTGPAGAVIITGLSSSSGGVVTRTWRRRAGDNSFQSRLGETGPPVLPIGFTLPAGQTAIAVETYVRVTPWVLAVSFFGQQVETLSGFGMYRPRLSSLTTVRP
jgi:Flp pilus assembly protein TadG